MATRGWQIEKLLQARTSYLVDEDSTFTASDSPHVIDVEAALTDGRDKARRGFCGYIACDGPGSMYVEISSDGTNYGSTITVASSEILDVGMLDVSKIRLTHSGTDSSYRSLIA